MRAFLWCGSLLLCLALAGSICADDQADAKPVLDKAMKAMGGEAKVAKLRTGTCKGKLTSQQGGEEITVIHESSWQGLRQYRLEAEIQVRGRSEKGVLVINGDKGWFKGPDKSEDAPKGIVPFVQDIFYSLRMPQLLPELSDKAYKLSPLGEIKIGDRAAVGLLITHKDHKDVNLYFDKENGLPIKTEIHLTEPKQNKEVTLECLYRRYKDFDGLKQPAEVIIKAEGIEITMELTELKPEDKLDDSAFAKP